VFHHLHTDHLGTPLEASNDAGQLTWQVTYRTWGNIVTEEITEIQQRLRFQGQYFDSELELSYNRFRYYDPHKQRFVSQDPNGLAGGTILSAYAPDPIGWIDPLGLSACSKEAELLRSGPNDTTVTVKTKAEADALLKEAFPDYQKVRGVGPQDAQGIRKKRKLMRFKAGGAFHKDYAMENDPDSGEPRVRGHEAGNPHGNCCHINIKRRDGKKVLIRIIK